MSDQKADYPKRLIEIDLPIFRISAHSRREKSIRHGHISTLHIWWARRPLAACRAVICAALWPDPADPLCPAAFRDSARTLMKSWAADQGKFQGPESFPRFLQIQQKPALLDDNHALRQALLDFIADFANWDNSTIPSYLKTSRALTQAAHEALGGDPGTRPLVVDPFAGGGSIPLEALRVGADAFASDLNPIPVLLNKVILEYIPKYGQRLSEEVRKWGEWIKGEAEKDLAEFYPTNGDRTNPTAYLWARTILSEAPGSGDTPIEVPLFRSTTVAKRRTEHIALKWKRDANNSIVTKRITRTYADGTSRRILRPELEISFQKNGSGVDAGTSRGGAATCPITQYTTSVEDVRKQLSLRMGGSIDARMLCVIGLNSNTSGRVYSHPSDTDETAVLRAAEELARRQAANREPLSFIPNGKLNHLRGFFNVVLYGMDDWGKLFSPRQLLSLTTFATLIKRAGQEIRLKHGDDFGAAVQTTLAMALGRLADYSSTLCMWASSGEFIAHTFGRQALPMVWDYAEVNPLSETGWSGACEWVVRVVEANTASHSAAGHVVCSPAQRQRLPDDSADATITDPPYYAAIPYADLSDYFYSWMQRAVGNVQPEVCVFEAAPKDEECVSLAHRAAMYRHKDSRWFEETMTQCCKESRRVNKPDGIGVYVFANKETSGWEAMLAAIVESGWIVTASWPIDTERGGRLRARNSAALASSVHLVCRPREKPDGSLVTNTVGDWRDVLAALPGRIHEWMPRLSEEGVVGADAIFSCLGPALEIFSRYSRVEKSNGDVVSLREYLEHVWATVSNEALSMIFKDADAAGLEPDARLTAMWLWTLGTAAPDGNGNGSADEGAEEEADEEEEDGGKQAKITGFVLEFDAARKIAQGLGIHLDKSPSVVEVKGDKARLLGVAERTKHLFGKDAADAPTTKKKPKKKDTQLTLFEALKQVDADVSAEQPELKAPQPGSTVLDRIHQAMILFAAGRGEALKRFLVEEGIGKDARFWKLAQSLSALYPPGIDEKRWVDGVLARKRSLGL